MNWIHHQRALHRDEAAQSGISAFQLLRHKSVSDVGHSRAAVALQIRAKKSQLPELRNKVLWKRTLAAVFFDDGNDFVVDESPSGLPDELFFVVQLRIKIDEINTGKSSHSFLFLSNF